MTPVVWRAFAVSIPMPEEQPVINMVLPRSLAPIFSSWMI